MRFAFDTSFGLTFYRPPIFTCLTRGQMGLPAWYSRCGLVSRHEVLPSRVGKPRSPREQYRNGARPAEMPIGYHRNVSAASRTEAPSDLIRARFADQTFSEKAL